MSVGKGFPISKAWSARYLRMDSGMLSRSSPFSMFFFAIVLILARLTDCQLGAECGGGVGRCIPVLKPNLNGALRHVNVLSDALADCGGRGGILVELDFQSAELILCSPLALLVLLLLCEGAFSRWTTGRGSDGGDGQGRRGRWREF